MQEKHTSAISSSMLRQHDALAARMLDSQGQLSGGHPHEILKHGGWEICNWSSSTIYPDYGAAKECFRAAEPSGGQEAAADGTPTAAAPW